jgi:hypothetical protein
MFNISAFPQERDSIIYIFPDKIEMKLYERMKDISTSDTCSFHFYLTTVEKNMFRIFVCHLCRNNYWVNNTNRFVLINNKKYPLVLEYDSIFSTHRHREVGEFGKRDDGFIFRTLLIYKGYNITFDKTGKHAVENWGEWDRNHVPF